MDCDVVIHDSLCTDLISCRGAEISSAAGFSPQFCYSTDEFFQIWVGCTAWPMLN